LAIAFELAGERVHLRLELVGGTTGDGLLAVFEHPRLQLRFTGAGVAP
jgi:hypothetical protein